MLTALCLTYNRLSAYMEQKNGTSGSWMKIEANVKAAQTLHSAVWPAGTRRLWLQELQGKNMGVNVELRAISEWKQHFT